MALLLVFAAVAAIGAGADQCAVQEEQRVDCGHLGIQEQECVAGGCCWKPASSGNDVPWCFHTGGAPGPSPPLPEQCKVSQWDKVDCHRGEAQGCGAAGCCWQPVSPNPDNLPWCYLQAGAVKTCTLKANPKSPFSAAELAEVRRYFEANLDVEGSGMVVAAPDHNTGPGGDYYYAWMRDGALSMGALLQTAGSVTEVETKMDHWLAWVERSYQQSDPNGDIMTEPKFHIPDGAPFVGGWCRPQTDGPGLRAMTLMAYAGAKPAVRERVWNLVKAQLDWVAANYSSPGCDLWEEVRSTDFFWNRYTMRKALLQGSAFAGAAGRDAGRAAAYAAAAEAIAKALAGHVGGDGFVAEAENRRVDTAVLEAFNVGDMEDGMFAPLSREAAQTLKVLTRYFCNAYGVNRQAAAAGMPGVLFGRYAGDSYAGGNPWVLLTASAATLLYRQATALAKGVTVGPAAEEALKGLLDQDVTSTSLIGGGDAILNHMKTFLTNGMHMNEQIERNTGAMVSAKDLTWNYANVLKAMQARDVALGAIRSAAVVEIAV